MCRSWAAAGAGAALAAGEEPLPRGKVTRTRGPDAAASVARVAEVMVGAVKGPYEIGKETISVLMPQRAGT